MGLERQGSSFSTRIKESELFSCFRRLIGRWMFRGFLAVSHLTNVLHQGRDGARTRDEGSHVKHAYMTTGIQPIRFLAPCIAQALSRA